MSRAESMSLPRTTGAARWTDQLWPDPMIVTTTAALVTAARNRLLNSTVTVAAGGFGGGNAVVNVANTASLGCLTATLVGGGADGVGQLIRFNPGTAAAIFQQQSRTNFLVPSANYQALGAARIYAVYAYSAGVVGSAVADSGLEMTYGGGLIQSQAAAGVGWGRSAAGLITARCQTVGGGASSNTTVTGAGTSFVGFDETKLHAYEIQTVSATATTEATVSWLIDDILVRRLSFGAGTVLPAFGGTVNGCWTVLVPNVAQAVTINVANIHLIQASSVPDCY